MFRLDGEVFLFGTAIAAPLKSIKIATICANSQQGPLGDSPQAAAGSSRTAAPIAIGAAVARAGRQCDGEAWEGDTMHVPITLLTAAAAAILNIWLGYRIAQHRHEFKVSVGDGGHEPLLRRMRAQANFIENAPFFLILLGGLELSRANRLGLAAVAEIGRA